MRRFVDVESSMERRDTEMLAIINRELKKSGIIRAIEDNKDDVVIGKKTIITQANMGKGKVELMIEVSNVPACNIKGITEKTKELYETAIMDMLEEVFADCLRFEPLF